MQNHTSYDATYVLTVTRDGSVVTGCSAPGTVGPVSAFPGSAPVTVTCSTAVGLGGWVQLEARESGTSGNKAAGRYNVKVGTYSVSVLPKTSTTVPVPAGPGQTQVFTVDNTGTLAAQFDFSTTGLCTAPVVCTGVSATSQTIAPADPPFSVTVTYNSGTAGSSGGQVKLKAQVNGGIEQDVGFVSVNAITSNIVADLAIINYDNHRSDLCEASCFAVRIAFSTIPYISLDQARRPHARLQP